MMNEMDLKKKIIMLCLYAVAALGYYDIANSSSISISV